MPIYEYECSSCEKIFEVIQKITDDPLEKCPDCGKEIKRLISRNSFILKGTGWFVTDYPKVSCEKKDNKEVNKKDEDKKRKNK